jgi:3-hydroxyisobutyrate dehydrogenase-like beta-hydroxyacid dehydrogenase
MDIGFIGLGQMGHGMARNLLKAGHRMVVYNRTRSKAEDLEKEGAQVADLPSDAAQGEVMITMLADDAVVETVLFGEGGAFAALRPRTIHLSMSTISVGFADRLTKEHAEIGVPYVAAPVMGRPDVAAAGKLAIVTAGDRAKIDHCQPLFDAIGQKTFVLGETPSAANVVKLAVNFLLSAMIESLGEACALMRKSDIDPHRFIDVITQTLFAAPAYKTYGSIIADQKYEPAGFAMALGLKDVRLALAAADARQVPMPVASLVRDHFLAGVATGNANADWSALARLCAHDAGLH